MATKQKLAETADVFGRKSFLTRAVNNGIQHVFKFPNGYGASVVRSPFSYGGKDGQWELGVAKFSSDHNWGLTYDTPITADVEGYLSEEAVSDLLTRIEALPSEVA